MQQPPGGPGRPAGTSGEQSVARSPKFPGAVVLAGAGVATLGAIMPWVQFANLFVANAYSTNGGALGILMALAIVGLGVWMVAGRFGIGVPIAVLVLATLLGLDCLLNIGYVVIQAVNAARSTSIFNTTPPMSLAEGVFICLVGSGVAGVGGIIGLVRGPAGQVR